MGNFLNQLDAPDNSETSAGEAAAAMDDTNPIDDDTITLGASFAIYETDGSKSQSQSNNNSATGEKSDSGFSLIKNIFGFHSDKESSATPKEKHLAKGNVQGIEVQCSPRRRRRSSDKNYARAFAVLRT